VRAEQGNNHREHELYGDTGSCSRKKTRWIRNIERDFISQGPIPFICEIKLAFMAKGYRRRGKAKERMNHEFEIVIR